ncbi:MAG: hypothetical protein M1813_008759 [Trichoglossum hirsutum]|jgi:hypothetical protein|nr:MAG: hypothetical protein M1813_008759 [Trichoglossum hirsutum]
MHFDDEIQIARNQPLLLYDVEAKRGRLVSGLSVALHIAHAWLPLQRDLQKPAIELPYAETLGDGGEAAWSAIKQGEGFELRGGTSGCDPYRLKDFITWILRAPDGRKAKAEEDLLQGFELNLSMKRTLKLRGWEFVDVVTRTPRFQVKEVLIDKKTAGPWRHVIAENHNIVVLFGDNIGDPIQPKRGEQICSSWARVPRSQNYLAASVPCLRQLFQPCEQTSCQKLFTKYCWHKPPNSHLFEDCDFNQASNCNRLQELKRLSKKLIPLGVIRDNGAVIFGKVAKTGRPCGERQPTQAEEETLDAAGGSDDSSVEAWADCRENSSFYSVSVHSEF